MPVMAEAPLPRRRFVAGGLLAAITGCRGSSTSISAPPLSSSTIESPGTDAGSAVASIFPLFERYPSLAKTRPRVELGKFPSLVENAKAFGEDVWIKRDDDFTRSLPTDASTFEPARLFGGNKIRKLELYFGDARARGKKRIVTTGGVGSNQTLAVALLGHALGFSVRMFLAPQPASTLTAKNLAADAASHAEMRLFTTVSEAHARALEDTDAYVIPPGGTTPLGTLGFVNAGLELAEDIRLGRIPAPRRVYLALGLGGSALGLAMGLALAGQRSTEVVGVRTSNPGSVTAATFRAIHQETLAFLNVRLPFSDLRLRIDDRFVGGGYGVPTAAGADAIERTRRTVGWELDPVYTGKAFAALLDDVENKNVDGPILFWNTASSRPVTKAPLAAPFDRFVKEA